VLAERAGAGSVCESCSFSFDSAGENAVGVGVWLAKHEWNSRGERGEERGQSVKSTLLLSR